MTRIRFLVHGKVQGVFYRQSALKIASSLGLKGWIKNNPDGTVECEVSGPDDKVGEYLAWANEGPPRAAVERIHHLAEERSAETGGHDFADFRILAD